VKAVLYFYGLRERAPRDTEPAAHAGLTWLPGDGWAAAAKRVTAPPEPSPQSLRDHDETARRAAAGAAFLPARFGQVFDSAAGLARSVAAQEAAVREALALVRGCVQMTLRLFGTPPPAEPLPAAPGRGPGTRYLAMRRAAVAPPPEVVALRGFLGGLVRAERWLPGRNPGFLGTLTHLVPSESLDAYRRAVAEPVGSVRSIHRSGPWLPYAFAPELHS
jgi:hypothetical protein